MNLPAFQNVSGSILFIRVVMTMKNAVVAGSMPYHSYIVNRNGRLATYLFRRKHCGTDGRSSAGRLSVCYDDSRPFAFVFAVENNGILRTTIDPSNDKLRIVVKSLRDWVLLVGASNRHKTTEKRKASIRKVITQAPNTPVPATPNILSRKEHRDANCVVRVLLPMLMMSKFIVHRSINETPQFVLPNFDG